MDFTTIQIGIEKNVARIALNRPEVHNAINATMIKELTEAVDWLDCRDDIRVIEICGNGKSFSAGADLNYMKEIAKYGVVAEPVEKTGTSTNQVDHDIYVRNLEDAKRLSKLFQTVYFCGTPVITVLHGAVIGGGNGIAAASDIVIAKKNTVFAFTEVKLGLTPATIAPFVIARCGEMAAKELMLSGRKFTAEEALNYKLVNFVGDDDEVNRRLEFFIRHFLEASPDAIRDCKHLIRAVCGHDERDNGIFLNTSTLIARERMSEDGQEGMKSFFEKRKPKWLE